MSLWIAIGFDIALFFKGIHRRSHQKADGYSPSVRMPTSGLPQNAPTYTHQSSHLNSFYRTRSASWRAKTPRKPE